MNPLNYILTPDSITLNVDRKNVFVLKASDPIKFEKTKQYLKSGDVESLVSLIFPAKRLPEYVNNVFTLTQTGKLYLTEDMEKENAEPVPVFLAERLLEFMNEELPFEPFANFWRNLQSNPSEGSKSQLYPFLERHHVPITPDGHFILYKKVRQSKSGDLWDKWTFDVGRDQGTVRWNPGDIAEMPREECVEDVNDSCGAGLHSASVGYVRTWYPDGVMIELKINPADVVSVPHVEVDGGKIRVCRALVLGVVEEGFEGNLYQEADLDYENDEFDDDDYDDFEDDDDFDEDEYGETESNGKHVYLEAIDSTAPYIEVSKDVPSWKSTLTISNGGTTYTLDPVTVSVGTAHYSGAQIDINSLEHRTGQQLIDLVYRYTGYKIPFSHKSKKSVLRLAAQKLSDAGHLA